MKMVTRMIVVCLLLLTFLPLVSQEGIAKPIGIGFTELNAGSSYEAVRNFLDDYSQYQLELMFWMVGPGDMQGILIFNLSLIDEVSLIEILENDNRVDAINSRWVPNFRPRQFAIKLFDTVDESEFINSYSEYGLDGSEPRWPFPFGFNLRSYGFNDTTIFTACLYNILRSDNRVETVFYDYYWRNGIITTTLNEEVDPVSFFSDFPFISYEQTAANIYSASFCFIATSDFKVLRSLRDDSRVRNAILLRFGFGTFTNWVPPQQSPVLESKDEVMRPLVNLIVYPNPVYNTNITIQMSEDNDFWKSSSDSEISIYNVKGQLVSTSTITNDVFAWDRKDMYNNDVPSGIYFIRVTTDDRTQTRKLLVIR
jgi:hypothetical protein